MTTSFHIQVLAVDGPCLTLRAAEPYWRPQSPYLNDREPDPRISSSLIPSRSLAMGLLLETTFETGIKIDRNGALVYAPPGLFRSSPLAQQLALEEKRLGCGLYVSHPWMACEAGRFVSCVGVTDRSWDAAHREATAKLPSWKRRPCALFHIAVSDPRWLAHLEQGMLWQSMAFDHHEGVCFLDPWCVSADVLGIAAGIESDLAFDQLPILADALETAGCHNSRLLDHCRGGGPHCPGCWALAAVLRWQRSIPDCHSGPAVAAGEAGIAAFRGLKPPQGTVSIWVFLEPKGPAWERVLRDQRGDDYDIFELGCEWVSGGEDLPIPIGSILDGVSHAASFAGQVAATAATLGIIEAYELLAVFDNASDATPASLPVACDPVFLGCFWWHE